MKHLLAVAALAVVSWPLAGRAFDDLFPGLAPEVRALAFGPAGFQATTEAGQSRRVDSPLIRLDAATSRNPSFVFESLLVIPGKATLLDAWNALANIGGLAGRTYHSHTRGRDIPLFEEAVRLESARAFARTLPDPPPAAAVPESEQTWVRFRDANFGATTYLAEARRGEYGLYYTLTNVKTMSFALIPVMREGDFHTAMYFEAIDEGLLFYSVTGISVASFAAKYISVGSAMEKRLDVIKQWIFDGIRGNSTQ